MPKGRPSKKKKQPKSQKKVQQKLNMTKDGSPKKSGKQKGRKASKTNKGVNQSNLEVRAQKKKTSTPEVPKNGTDKADTPEEDKSGNPSGNATSQVNEDGKQINAEDAGRIEKSLANKDEDKATNNNNTQEAEKEECEVSVASDQTSRTEINANHSNHHYNDSDGEASWNVSATTQDDENTVNSNETSKYNKGNENKVVLPAFTRYQMMILLDPENKEEEIKENSDQQENSPAQRIAEKLSSFTQHMVSIDKEARIMSWKTSPNFTYTDLEEFPTKTAELAKYFQGFRENVKADKRVYLRVAIHTPNSQTRLFTELQEWMKLFGYSMNKCIIQSETSTCIGWLVYSSQYTDTESLRQRMMYISQFEWGFKLVAITEEDKSESWLKRSKAVGIYVPTPMKDTAINIIGEHFEASMDTQNNIPDFTDKFLFMEPERTYKGKKSRQLYYKQMVERHRIHIESLVPEISYGINTDLDREYHFKMIDDTTAYTLTLRDIILDLKVESNDSIMTGTRLFHSIDYFSDSTNLWINGQRCDGGPCCVFTYYEDCASEASTMIRGMGKMVMKEYNREVAEKMFNISHFRGCKGYRWIPSMRRFSTPQIRQMKANQVNDNMLPAIQILMKKKEQLEQERMQKEPAENTQNKSNKKDTVDAATDQANTTSQANNNPTTVNDNESVESNITEEMRAKQITNIANIAKDPDLDSLANESEAGNKPSKVDCNDEESVASSLTNVSATSNISNSGYSISSGSTNNDNVTITSRQNKYDVNANVIAEIAKADSDTDLTKEELEKRVLAYQELKINEAKSRALIEIEKFVKEYNVPTTTIQPPKPIPSEMNDITIISKHPSNAQQITPVQLFDNEDVGKAASPPSKDRDTSNATASSLSSKAIIHQTPQTNANNATNTSIPSYLEIAKINTNPPKTSTNSTEELQIKPVRKSKRLQSNQQNPTSTEEGTGDKK